MCPSPVPFSRGRGRVLRFSGSVTRIPPDPSEAVCLRPARAAAQRPLSPGETSRREAPPYAPVPSTCAPNQVAVSCSLGPPQTRTGSRQGMCTGVGRQASRGPYFEARFRRHLQRKNLHWFELHSAFRVQALPEAFFALHSPALGTRPQNSVDWQSESRLHRHFPFGIKQLALQRPVTHSLAT